jgi:hypothetical protein
MLVSDSASSHEARICLSSANGCTRTNTLTKANLLYAEDFHDSFYVDSRVFALTLYLCHYSHRCQHPLYNLDVVRQLFRMSTVHPSMFANQLASRRP